MRSGICEDRAPLLGTLQHAIDLNTAWVEIQHAVARVRPLKLDLAGMNIDAARHAFVILATPARERARRHNGWQYTVIDQTAQPGADNGAIDWERNVDTALNRGTTTVECCSRTV